MKLREGDRVRVLASIGRSAEGTVAQDWSGTGKVLVVLDGRKKPVPKDPGRVKLLERPAPSTSASPPATTKRSRVALARASTTKAPPLVAQPKPQGPYRSRAYLRFVASKPCMVDGCKAPAPSDPHHWGSTRGMSQKVDDTRTVPLCREHHDYVHGPGAGAFPGVSAVATKFLMLNRQVALLTEWLRLADGERVSARRAG